MNVFFCTACQRAAPRLLQLVWGLTISLGLAACGPAPRTHQSQSATKLTVAPPPAPKTLESTLRLDPGVEEIPFYPQIAESSHGDIVAVWEQFDGEHYNIWGNSRRAHHGWGRASLIQANDTGHSYNPRVAINANGQAMAVWVHMDGAADSYNIWSSRLEPGTGWDAATRVETDHAGPSYAPNVVIDDRGNAVASWQQSDGKQVNVWASRFVADTGWGQASRLEHGAGDLGAPHVAVDAGGNAMVVWLRFHLDRSDLWASRYVVAGGAWDKALRIDAVHGYVHTPVVMAAAGVPGQFTVLLDHPERFVTGPASVWASDFQPDRGWHTRSAACASRLQALATAGVDKARLAASARPPNTADADSCS